MTQIDIAALVADREAGTKGPWNLDGPVWNQIIWTDAENRICFMAHSDGLNDARDLANARRIARVPDLETALIEQAETIKRLTHLLEQSREWNWISFYEACETEDGMQEAMVCLPTLCALDKEISEALGECK